MRPDGVFFDAHQRAPLDQDWSRPLQQFVKDPHCLRHLTKHYSPQVADEVWAAVLEELGLSGAQVPPRPDLAPPAPAAPAAPSVPAAPSAPAAPPRPAGPAHGLVANDSDASALGLAALAAKVAALIDPAVPLEVGKSLSWGELSRSGWDQPGYRSARAGRVALTLEYSLSDGVGGTQDVYAGTYAFVSELPGGASVALALTGGPTLKVTVKARAELQPALAALVGAEHLAFSALPA